MSRCAALLAVALAAACGAPPAPAVPASPEQRRLAAADVALECLGSGGTECLQRSSLDRAWLAQGHLELVATAPAPVLGSRLLAASDRLRSDNEAGRRLTSLAERARPMAEDLSCEPRASEPLGARLRRRRDELVRRAENLGLGATSIAPVVAELDATAGALDDAFLVTADCERGELFVLVAAPARRAASSAASARATEADVALGRTPTTTWRPIAIAASRDALTRGAPLAAPAPAPPLDDPARPGSVHPWLPVGEAEL